MQFLLIVEESSPFHEIKPKAKTSLKLTIFKHIRIVEEEIPPWSNPIPICHTFETHPHGVLAVSFHYKIPFTRQHFNKGPLLNFNGVVKLYRKNLVWQDKCVHKEWQIIEKISQEQSKHCCSTLSEIYTISQRMLKLSKGPLLNCSRVKRSAANDPRCTVKWEQTTLAE